MAPTIVGVVAGGVAAFWLARLMTEFLVGVGPTDPLTFLITAMVFLAVAAAAGTEPAIRALRVDPANALRAN